MAVRDTDAIPKVAGAGAVFDLNGEPVQRMHNGVLISAGRYHGAWMTEVIRRLRGHHEPQEELAFHTILERLASDTAAPTMIELGSFWGYYSLWAKRRIPSLALVMVEPDLQSLAVGRHNLELNAMDATILHAAIGAEHERVVSLRWDSDGQEHINRQLSIDGIIADLGIGSVDLLLCDIQGAETAALIGATEALAERRIRFLLVSTHHHSISQDPLTHQHCLGLLRSAGAHVIAEHSVLESCSGDGLIAVSMARGDRDLHAPVSIIRSRDSLFGEPEWELARMLGTESADDRLTTSAVIVPTSSGG